MATGPERRVDTRTFLVIAYYRNEDGPVSKFTFPCTVHAVGEMVEKSIKAGATRVEVEPEWSLAVAP